MYAKGGHVQGPSSGDNVAEMLSSGQYELPASAFRHYGHGLLEKLNTTGFPLVECEEKKPVLTDKERLLIVAESIEQFWGPLAHELVKDDKLPGIAAGDAKTLRDIAGRL